jgi:hypothetical protein
MIVTLLQGTPDTSKLNKHNYNIHSEIKGILHDSIVIGMLYGVMHSAMRVLHSSAFINVAVIILL